MAEVIYSLKKKKGTEELHLFTAILNSDGTCDANNYSICKKMQLCDKIDNIFECYSERSARLKCEEIGEHVCEACVSHLYATV